MKQLRVLILVWFFTLLPQIIFAQAVNWARGGGTVWGTSVSTAHERAKLMTVDDNGNVYVASFIASGIVYADTFSGGTLSSGNILLSSYDCDGNMRWAKLITSRSGCEVTGMVYSNGNIYVSGSFFRTRGVVYIGSDTTLYSGSDIVAGLLSIDTVANFNWIQMIGDNTSTSFSGSAAALGNVCIDRNRNIHYVKPLLAGVPLTSSLTSINATYDFTYSPSGTLLRIQRLQMDSANYVTNAEIDTSSGKLYVRGTTYGTFSIVYGRDFIAAFDTGRNLIWMDTAKSLTGLGSMSFGSIKSDNNGHVYFTGFGYGSCIYRNDTIVTAISGGYVVAFVIKADTSGRRQWVTRYSGTTACGLLDLAISPTNKIAAVGGILGQVSTDHQSIISYAGEVNNSYFTVLDTGGGVISLIQLHGTSSYQDGLFAAAYDGKGNLYMGGMCDSVWLDSVGYRSHGGTTDFFVMKYGVDCNCSTMPWAWFDTARSGTGGSTVAFTYTGITAGIDSIRWQFGDGSTSASWNPTHTYSSIDTYYAQVFIYSPCGNDMHYVDVDVRCLAAPTAGLSVSGSTSGTRSFTYTGTTTGIDSLVWSFGDGSRATGNTVSHTYSATGSYTVSITAYNHCGSHAATARVSVPCLSRPSALHTVSGSIYSKSFTYTGSTTAIDSIVWKFGDGSRATGTSASHTYTSIGSFTACVYAYNTCGVDTDCTTITVPCVATPVAAFSHSGVPTTTFTYTSSISGVDSIVWQFGDGGRATGATTSHTYATIDTFTACVIAYSRCGNDTECRSIHIPCFTSPVISASASGSGHTWTMTFTGTTVIDSLNWNFGDGNSAPGGTVIHTYAHTGIYNACAYVATPCGWDTGCVSITVPCDTLVASFTDTGSLYVGFQYTGTTAYTDSIVWLFGDGNRDTGHMASHAYAASGTYHVCVIDRKSVV